MRIGICSGLGNIHKVEQFGFDYIEPALNGVALMEADAFSKAKTAVDGCSIKCETFNCFFPWDFHIAGPDTNIHQICEYTKRAVERAAILGGKVVVVGNGGARKIPDRWDRAEGLKQISDTFAIIGQEAALYGITAVLEPLNRNETNTFNTVTEGLSFIKTLNHPHIKLLIDFFHMRVEGESIKCIAETEGYIQHLHIANSEGRAYPMNREEDIYAPFFEAIKRAGYNQRVSIEASTRDFDNDAPASLNLLRELAGSEIGD